jgi:hypothetical protein
MTPSDESPTFEVIRHDKGRPMAGHLFVGVASVARLRLVGTWIVVATPDTLAGPQAALGHPGDKCI